MPWYDMDMEWYGHECITPSPVLVYGLGCTFLGRCFPEKLLLKERDSARMTSEISPGRNARTQDLVEKHELNGEEVEILHWVQKSERWAVRRASGAVLSIRAKNLEALAEKDCKSSTLEGIICQISGQFSYVCSVHLSAS